MYALLFCSALSLTHARRHALLLGRSLVNIAHMPPWESRVCRCCRAWQLDSFTQLRGFRFVHRGDVIPRLPLINYQHHGTLIWLRDRSDNPVEVYERGVDAPWRQTCLCANLNVAAHSIIRQPDGRSPYGEAADAASRNSGMPEGAAEDSQEQAPASTPVGPPTLGLGLSGLTLPGCCGACCLQSEDVAWEEGDCENASRFRGYLAAIHRCPIEKVRDPRPLVPLRSALPTRCQ